MCLLDDINLYSDDGALYCAMENRGDQRTFNEKKHPNKNCTFEQITVTGEYILSGLTIVSADKYPKILIILQHFSSFLN